ncbi:MAG: amino acid adenylation domain-containing protein, partial [Pirellulales bacterium]
MHIGPDTIVGLFMPRQPELFAALLATWKAGAAYLPIDVKHPARRIEFMLEDARPALVLTHSSCVDQLPSTTAKVLVVDKPTVLPATNGRQTPSREANADDLAYVIYTSGSTGKPKGVMVRHGGLRNLIHAQRVLFDVQPGERVLQFSNLSFDASVWEIALSLGAGAELVIPEQQCSLTGSALLNELKDQEINYLTIPPSILATVEYEPLPALHTIVSAGESCPTELAATWCVDRQFFNAYGPTETTVCATANRCLTGEDVRSTGGPIANMKVYLLDEQLQPVPTGVPGEVCIAGAGLAVGYLNRPELTAERFVPNPYCSDHGATLYRTGDVACFHADGGLEFLGRRDHQAKVRGFRIELGEIETALLEHDDVAQTLVVAEREADGIDRLVAYYVAVDRRQPNVSQLRNHLKEQLPEYMVPSSFLRLDEFPLNVNGKIDRHALPKTDAGRPAIAAQYAPPSTDTERTLVEIWKNVLQIERVGIHDNFFDLGGASLQAVRVVDQSATKGLTFAPEVLFQYQTVAELASIADGQPNDGPPRPTKNSATLAPQSTASEGHRTTQSEATPIAPCQVTTQRQNIVIESLGVYLPEQIVSSDEVVRGCRQPLDFPLERMTGIQSRRQAAPNEYSIDLARQAIQNCLENSRYESQHIELLIACNISRYDGPRHGISFEPSTAVCLKDQLGFTNALAFDVSNACAGMFTAIEIADSFIQSGAVRRAMVVSGEYITHLTQTAQFEIESFIDPQLACLTLGDSGVAAILEAAPTSATGFHDLELYTLGEYSNLCTAKAINQAYGAAKMTVDPVRATAVTIGQAVSHARRILDRNGWTPERLDHLIMHQTSETTLDGAVQELNEAFGHKVCDRTNTIYNIAERGNTATTTHLVALWDNIRSGKINAGDDIVFAISGSGQTVGTALYTLDDLPDRIRGGGPHGATTQGIQAAMPEPRTVGVQVAGVGTLPKGFADVGDTRAMLKSADLLPSGCDPASTNPAASATEGDTNHTSGRV